MAGKIIADFMFGVGQVITGLVNDLVTGGTDKALTAEQGKILYNKSFGINQDYIDKKSIRALNTTYYNTTEKTIFVSVGITLSNTQQGTATAYVNGKSVATNSFVGVSNPYDVGVVFPVAAGSSYLVKSITGVGVLDFWMEFTL